MSRNWLAQLDSALPNALAELLTLPNPEIALGEHEHWFRADCSMDDAARYLAKLPFSRLYDVEPLGLRLHTARLVSLASPEVTFVPLRQAINFSLPVASFTTVRLQRVEMSLVRCSIERVAAYLELPASSLPMLLESTAQVRLERWSFAASGKGTILFFGDPLPSFLGTRFWRSGRVAIPVGYRPSPNLSGESLERVMGCEPDELVLIREDLQVESISNENFVRATRSALRETLRVGIGDGT